MLTDSGGMLINWDMAKTQTVSLLYTWSDYLWIWLCWLDLQGTWQFMLAALIAHIFTPTTHDFRDDLESSLWVLMWLFLMYSLCMNKDQVVLFFDSTLDPQVKGQMGGYNKADWLKGSMFTMKVSFEGRPVLDKLTQQLGHLFASCYEPPLTVSNQGTLEHICEVLQNDPTMFANLKLYNHPAWSHSLHLESLSSHTATIEIYSHALKDPDGVPLMLQWSRTCVMMGRLLLSIQRVIGPPHSSLTLQRHMDLHHLIIVKMIWFLRLAPWTLNGQIPPPMEIWR